MKPFITFFLLCLSIQVYSQDSLDIRYHTISVEYFGELGLHPGAKIDFGLSLWINRNLNGKKGRIFYQKMILRPNIGYYNIPKYTNNFFLGGDVSLQFITQKSNTRKYFIFESFVGFKYMRYAYIGRVYESNNSGSFTELENAGGYSKLFSSGFLIGGSLPYKSLEWLAGIEYFIEFPEDKLIIYHPTARFGVRIKL